VKKIITFAIAVLGTSPVFGHHSDAGIAMSAAVPLQGTVTEFSWRNPHVYFTMETIDARGETVEWQVQMGATNTSIRKGWTSESLAAGDRVTVLLHPARNGRPYGIIESLQTEGGVDLSNPLYAPQVGASASSLEGIWMTNRSELVSYPGGFDGFFRAELKLTAKGVAAQAAYDELSEENPESRCIGRPTPGMIVSSHLFPLQIQLDEGNEIVVIRSEIWDEQRIVYMDGRAHPENGERFASGHSIGRWDGGTLIVDTASFTDHRSPYQIGVPSGAQKRVVEKYRLNEDGTRLVVEFVLEDPEYIIEPLPHRRELIYSPQLEFLGFNCDPRATRRFLLQ